jgi:hypothetical protein
LALIGCRQTVRLLTGDFLFLLRGKRTRQYSLDGVADFETQAYEAARRARNDRKPYLLRAAARSCGRALIAALPVTVATLVRTSPFLQCLIRKQLQFAID